MRAEPLTLNYWICCCCFSSAESHVTHLWHQRCVTWDSADYIPIAEHIGTCILRNLTLHIFDMAFFYDEFLRDVLFFAVGGVSSVAILKIWENRESVLREIRRRFDSNETRQPEEHDERFDWEGKSSVSYENISGSRAFFSRATLGECSEWIFRLIIKLWSKRHVFFLVAEGW